MKYLLAGLLSVTSWVGVTAQVQFGVKAGVNLSTLTGSDVRGASSKVGFQGGLLAAAKLSDTWILQPEVNFSMQGAKAFGGTIQYTVPLSYLNIPVLLKYQDESGLFAETGPQFGVLLSAKATANGSTIDVKNEYKSTDFSWAFGVGYLVKPANVGIDLRYNLGLTNIENPTGTGSNGSIRNGVFQLGIFYLFGDGGESHHGSGAGSGKK